MHPSDVARQRLANLGLDGPVGATPSDTVTALGAVQAQEYPVSLWSVGARCGADATGVTASLTRPDVVRTHVLRSTWHYAPAADLRWMLALTADRVHASSAYYYRQHGIDDTVRRRAYAVLESLLADTDGLPRPEVAAAFADAGLPASGAGFALLLMASELDGVVCGGAPRGGKHTYALLERRLPPGPELNRDEALAELTWRYFATHGPASRADFAWWSGLLRADVDRGLALVGDRLRRDELDDVPVWGPADAPTRPPTRGDPSVRLIQTFDEYVVGYTQTRYVLDPARHWKDSSIGAPALLVDGQVAGAWARTVRRGTVTVTVTPYRSLTTAEREGVEREAAAYAAFLGVGLAVELREVRPDIA